MFSVAVTPLTRYALSNEGAPLIVKLPPGPVACTDGASSNDEVTSRLVGKFAIRSCL
jgi:hypothetical protein